MELYPWQKKAVEALDDGKILCGGVGSGKSITALAYYDTHHKGLPLYIITTAKKRDSLEWLGDMAHFALYPSGMSAAPVKVDSWNNIKKYVSVGGAFFILDEQHLVGKGSWVRSFLQIAKRNKWILLSATPGDTWMDYIPVFIANGWYRNRTEFIANHVRMKQTYQGYPEITGYFGEKKLERLRKQVLVTMDYTRHTVRMREDVHAEHDAEAVRRLVKTYWNELDDKPCENSSEFCSVLRRIIYTHPSRVDAVLRLLEGTPRAIVFYNYTFELEALREGLSSKGIPWAEWNGERHDPLPSGDRWAYLCQYTAAHDGWNCITTDTIIFLSPTYSYRVREQSEGRIDRLNTPYDVLHYYTVRSRAKFETAVHNAVKKKKRFNEKSWAARYERNTS